MDFAGSGAATTASRSDHTTAGSSIVTGSIGAAQLGANSVDSSEIASGAVRSSEVEDGSLTGADIQDGSITAADLDPSITAGVGSSGSVTIGHAAFREDSQSAHFDDLLIPANGHLTRPEDVPSTACMTASVQLPDGVTVNRFRMVIIDNNAVSNFRFRLRRTNLADNGANTGSVQTMGDITTSGDSSFVRHFDDTGIPNAVVNATGFAYAIDGCLTTAAAGDADLFAAQIFY